MILLLFSDVFEYVVVDIYVVVVVLVVVEDVTHIDKLEFGILVCFSIQ